MNFLLPLWIAPALLLVPAMGMLSALPARDALGRELRRKCLHVGLGLAALALPLVLTETWMIMAGLVLACAWLIAVRALRCLRSRFGGVLFDCHRRSRGELYFALAIACLLLLTPESQLLYAIPVLILALADAAAAIAGRLLPSRPLSRPFAGKTVAGCTTFFVVAAGICLALLTLHGGLPGWQVLIAALLVATVTCMAEVVCRHGLDNLSVPLAAWACLKLLQGSADPASAFAQELHQGMSVLTGGAL